MENAVYYDNSTLEAVANKPLSISEVLNFFTGSWISALHTTWLGKAGFLLEPKWLSIDFWWQDGKMRPLIPSCSYLPPPPSLGLRVGRDIARCKGARSSPTLGSQSAAKTTSIPTPHDRANEGAERVNSLVCAANSRVEGKLLGLCAGQPNRRRCVYVSTPKILSTV